MPVVMNMPDKGNNKPNPSSPPKRSSPATGGGSLSDPRMRIGLVAVLLLLAVGLLGWSLGWFGGGASPSTAGNTPPLPAKAAAPAAPEDTGNTQAGSPAASNEDANANGHKRNQDLDPDALRGMLENKKGNK